VITAQVSLYPLRQVSIGPAIREAVRVFRQRGGFIGMALIVGDGFREVE